MLLLSRTTATTSLLLAVAACWMQCATAFVVPLTTPVSSSSTSSSSVLYISSWGTKGPPAFRQDTMSKDPEKYVQDYLPEPTAVEARANIDETILVSGVANAKDRTDQFLFDLLNHEDSAFEFSTIKAFVKSTSFSKKRLLSRSARYTGLLDKLDFVEANEGTTLPTVEQLTNVKSWLAVLNKEEDDNMDLLATCQEIATLSSQATSLENISILLMGANELDATACQNVVDALKTSNKQYTVVAVGKIEDRPEGQNYYHYGDFGTNDAVLPAKSVFSREEAYRMITELLQLECGVNTAFSFAEIYNVNATETKLIKGLRQAGYARPQEIDHMIRKGPKAYKEAIENFKKENPDAAKGYTTNAWWEAEEYQKSRRKSDEKLAKELESLKDEKTKEIEAVATEWAKREYFRQSMEGTIINDMTEEDFIKSVWDRAMFEGDIKYRQKMGEATDEEKELEDFKTKQKRKEETMLKRAKQELAEVLGEDVSSGDDKKDNNGDDDKPKSE